MYGFARVQAAVDRRQRFEDQREKWVETREEGDGPVEYLMVRCEESGQPWARQRVLRFNEYEIREWQTIRDESFPNWERIAIMLLPLALLAIGIAAWWIFRSIATGVVALLVMWASYFFFAARRETRRTAELKERKRRILSRYGNIPEEDVGMADQYYKSYVIQPEIPC